MNHAAINTDKEIWRKIPRDYYSPSIHVTEFSGIGINVGGHVLVAPIEKWHKAGNEYLAVSDLKDKCKENSTMLPLHTVLILVFGALVLGFCIGVRF